VIKRTPPQKDEYNKPTGPKITLNNNAPATLLYGNPEVVCVDIIVIMKSFFNPKNVRSTRAFLRELL
jgi:hypothetical protein